MTTITKKLYGMTVGELKELLKDIDDSVEIEWDEIGRGSGIETVELEISTYDCPDIDPTVCINIETIEPY